jgi:hypothetical protein
VILLTHFPKCWDYKRELPCQVTLPFFFVVVYLFIYSYVYTLFGPSLPPVPHPLLLSLPGKTCSALFSNFVEEKT